MNDVQWLTPRGSIYRWGWMRDYRNIKAWHPFFYWTLDTCPHRHAMCFAFNEL